MNEAASGDWSLDAHCWRHVVPPLAVATIPPPALPPPWAPNAQPCEASGNDTATRVRALPTFTAVQWAPPSVVVASWPGCEGGAAHPRESSREDRPVYSPVAGCCCQR